MYEELFEEPITIDMTTPPTPFDSTIELLEVLGKDSSKLVVLKNQYLMKKVWNKMIQTYDWVSFDKVIGKYVEDNETR